MEDTTVSIDPESADAAPAATNNPTEKGAPTGTDAPVDTAPPEDDSAIKAINRCMRAWNHAYKKETAGSAEDESTIRAQRIAEDAYLRATPLLRGYTNICDFIACINYATITCIIMPIRAQQLLANARIALSTVYHQPRPVSERGPVGRPPKSPAVEEIK
jgi:hypothetical protein